ncbi:hypothetical protein FACS189461_4590 [Spirochaetia bacterium]|nr:hypothetical protein FACS189461_4590 [Spirochaetia bacterium]
MKIFKSENENRNYILNEIIKVYGNDYMIGKEISVPYRQIYIPKDNKIELETWCFKQDICIYKTLYQKNRKNKDASINYNGNEIINITFEKDNVQNKNDVALPLLIIETKMAKNITTHELLAYSEKVQMIKTIFPYCKYLLLVFGKPPKRAYLHGLNFDRIIGIEEITKNEIKNILEIINEEMLEVKDSIKSII